MELPTDSLAQMAVSFSDWLLRFARRIAKLPSGRYLISLTISTKPDWSIVWLGDVEAGGPLTIAGDAHRTT